MNQDPVQNLPRLVELWKQIALRYRNQPKSLMFELLNEPHDQLDDERWQEAFPTLLKAIRDSNPDRIILIGPAYLNAVDRLDKIQLPPQDRRIIGTFHYYKPLQFTHQGAFWLNDSAPWRGTRWMGTPQEREELRNDFERAAAWSTIGRRTWRIGRCGRGPWRVRRKNGASAGPIGSSAPSSARTTPQRGGGGDRSSMPFWTKTDTPSTKPDT